MKKKISLFLVFMLALSVIPNITASADYTDSYTVYNYYKWYDGHLYLSMNDSGSTMNASVKLGTGTGWNLHVAGHIRYRLYGQEYQDEYFCGETGGAYTTLTTDILTDGRFSDATLYWAFNKSLYGEPYIRNEKCIPQESYYDNILYVCYGCY